MADFSSLPDDHFITTAQFTKRTYRDTYPSIDPCRPELSQAGRVVVITGASKGLGRKGFAPSFAKAGAKALVLVARSIGELIEAADEIRQINSAVRVMIQDMDVTDENAISDLFAKIKKEFGTADILINNAASASPACSVRNTDFTSFWRDFEVNVKGTALMTAHFLQLVGESKSASVINIASHGGITATPTLASYCLSKMVQIQLQRFVASENSNIRAVSLHPGIVITNLTNPAFERFSKDTPALSGDTALWIASDRAHFMNGRYMEANWSVDELEERQAEIVSQGWLVMELNAVLGKDQFGP